MHPPVSQLMAIQALTVQRKTYLRVCLMSPSYCASRRRGVRTPEEVTSPGTGCSSEDELFEQPDEGYVTLALYKD